MVSWLKLRAQDIIMILAAIAMLGWPVFMWLGF
jgi:hypothetical protein